jgi:hypothetical protein
MMSSRERCLEADKSFEGLTSRQIARARTFFCAIDGPFGLWSTLPQCHRSEQTSATRRFRRVVAFSMR